MPSDERDSDELRLLLATARVIEHITLPEPSGSRSAQGIERVVLEGNIRAFFKRGDVDPPGEIGARREVAAYEVARLMGLDDMLPVVAVRKVPVEGGGEAFVAAMEFLSGPPDSPSAEHFSRLDQERAGVFDAVIANTDRGGHNWIGQEVGDHVRLRLIDHELAFVPGGVVNSSFWSLIGQTVPPALRELVSRVADELPKSAIGDLLPTEEFEALIGRVEDLRRTF